jgi:hypothetical protein
MAKSGKRKEYKAQDEIGIVLVGGPLAGACFGWFRGLWEGGGKAMGMTITIGLFIGLIGGGIYAAKLIKFARQFKITKNDPYTIERVKEHFGAPTNIVKDTDVSYYTFGEESLGGIVKRNHVFTTDGKGVVVKHEVESL